MIIAIAQDVKTSEILMVAYMNQKALEKTLKTKKAHYWSTSRAELWLKGESSGHEQLVHQVLIDCDEDAIILKVEQKGGACHTGHYSCFFRELDLDNKERIKTIGKKIFNPRKIYGEN